MSQEASTFIIVREDRGVDPTTLVVEALRIGRDPDSELLLNHPTISRQQAGIKEIQGHFYLFHFSSTNATTLNGKLVAPEEPEALASGDNVRAGPFFLQIDRKGEVLVITVTLQFGLLIGQVEARGEQLLAESAARRAGAPPPKALADALDLFWGKRSRKKAGRKSPLHPRRPPRLGKARFNWTPTRDLVRPWPFAVFLWSAVVLGVLSLAAAFGYTAAYAPHPISNAHSLTSFSLTPAVAKQPNAGSCTTCHSLRSGMETRCASCHTTEAFVGTVTRSHADAGIGCLDCHSEHSEKGIEPMQVALNSCTKCHSDKNKKTYNNRTVGTPHGGTLGYPVINGEWKWKGLDAEELLARPKIASLRLPTDTEQLWRRKQFHALHIYRVKATGGIKGVAGAESDSPPVLSCSSCHRSFGSLDREYARQTCGQCHSGLSFASGRALLAAGAPNCISCHVQHVKDKRHWNPDLLAGSTPPTAEGK
ncbi:MAG: FHA domain-containing protein [Acidobacteriota bacterium]|nr:FHA domain-containing protein [Acidobacteriota bacterium]